MNLETFFLTLLRVIASEYCFGVRYKEPDTDILMCIYSKSACFLAYRSKGGGGGSALSTDV